LQMKPQLPRNSPLQTSLSPLVNPLFDTSGD
jgi:hypothetical protein